MDEAGQSSPSMGEDVNSQERSSAGKYHCPFLQHEQYGQHGQLSNLPKACQNKFESTTIKRLTAHLKIYHCGNSKTSRADLTEEYVASLRKLPNLRRKNPGEKWKAIYRDIFRIPPEEETPPPFSFTFEQYLQGAAEPSSVFLASAMDCVRRNNPVFEEFQVEWMAREGLKVAMHLATMLSETGGASTSLENVHSGPAMTTEFDPNHASYISPDGNWSDDNLNGYN